METNIEKLDNKKLYENYLENANKSLDQNSKRSISAVLANQYLLEMQRRDSEKSNKIMRRWTIVIGIMTVVMTIATILNLLVALGRIG